MGISEELPLMVDEDFLGELADIRRLMAAYEENFGEMKNIQDKILKLGWTPGESESSSSDLQRLGTKNKEIRQSIAEVSEEVR